MGLLSIERYLHKMRLLACKDEVSQEEVKEVTAPTYAFGHELGIALYSLLAKRVGLPPIACDLERTKKGAVLLHKRGYYPWQSLPYPRDHAELGAALYKLGKVEEAQAMLRWQKGVEDHKGCPIFSLYMQESTLRKADLDCAYSTFKEVLFDKTAPPPLFIDEELGLVVKREEGATIFCTASGCKSAMGGYLVGEGGVVAFGPQKQPLGECKDFGIASYAKECSLSSDKQGFSLSYLARVAKNSKRGGALSYIQDAAFSGLWARPTFTYKEGELTISCGFEGVASYAKYAFSFFAKADHCLVSGSHKLQPCSLDRYQGPCQKVEFVTGEDHLILSVDKGASQMEVIPLASDDSFWGADFLVGLFLDAPTLSCRLKY